MGRYSEIEWTDATWNPWVGCKKVSAGCKNCYMFRDQKRWGNDPSVIRRTSNATFYAPPKWNRGLRVFTCSWSDFFIEEADGWRGDAWDVIRKTPHLTYLVLTKRPKNIMDRLPADWGNGWENVWLGVTTEDQEQVDKRIPVLSGIPAVIRFISAEPLLEGIDVSKYTDYIDWVIVGGESGGNCRDFKKEWAENIIDQMHNTPVFVKQMSGATKKQRSNIPASIMRREIPG